MKSKLEAYFKSVEFRTILIATLAFIGMSYGYLFANEFFSHDSVTFTRYWDGSFSFYYSIGRFVIPFYELLKGRDLVSPWIVGILFSIWMTVSGVLTVRFFDVKTKLPIILICGFLCVNVSMGMTGATYVYCLDEYAFALCLAIFSAYCFCRSERQFAKYSVCVGILSCILVLGIYQAYFSVIVFFCFADAFCRNIENPTPGRVIKRGICYIAYMLIGLVLYMGIYQGLCFLKGVSVVRQDETIIKSGISQILAVILDAVRNYGDYLFRTETMLGKLIPIIDGILIMYLVVLLVKGFFSKRINFINKMLLVLLVMLFPIVLNLMRVAVPKAGILLVYSRELIYLWCIVCIEKFDFAFSGLRKGVRVIIPLLLIVVLWDNTLILNQAYTKKQLEKTATISLVTRMLDEVEEIDGYVPGETPVYIAGELRYNRYFEGKERTKNNFNSMSGIRYDISATYNLHNYIVKYLNYPMKLTFDAEIKKKEDVVQMPVFPEKGSVQMIDGVVVLKVSN